MLSAQARPVPVDASVSKFSDNGDPKVVMLPLLVKADELGISSEPARRNRSDKNISPVNKLEREATSRRHAGVDSCLLLGGSIELSFRL